MTSQSVSSIDTRNKGDYATTILELAKLQKQNARIIGGLCCTDEVQSSFRNEMDSLESRIDKLERLMTFIFFNLNHEDLDLSIDEMYGDWA